MKCLAFAVILAACTSDPMMAMNRDASADRVSDASDTFSVDAPAPHEDCSAYCKSLLNICAMYPQFDTMTACMNACRYYPPPAPNDNPSNTLGCRKTHLEAVFQGWGHCWHAGPFGYSGCGAQCDGFCQIAVPWCGTFPSVAACKTECQTWPNITDEGGNVAFRANEPTTGNSLDCREAMLVKALRSESDRVTYCPLAVTNSATCR